MEREWKLGDDLSSSDNLLDGITFDELILTVHCNCREITKSAVERELQRILNIRMQDMKFLLKNNIVAIIKEARKGRDV